MKKLLLLLFLVTATITAQSSDTYAKVKIFKILAGGDTELMLTEIYNNTSTVYPVQKKLIVSNDKNMVIISDIMIIEIKSTKYGQHIYFEGYNQNRAKIQGILTEHSLSLATGNVMYVFYDIIQFSDKI